MRSDQRDIPAREFADYSTRTREQYIYRNFIHS